jgi:hypothetical protein
MHHQNSVFCILILLGLAITGLHAQEAILSSGVDVSGTTGSVSYSIGQVFYSTHSGPDGYSSAEGVQQPYEIQVITGLNQNTDINIELSIYPNPVKNTLLLKIDDDIHKNYIYYLYNANGKLLESKNILGKNSNINMEYLKAASYFLKVTANQKEIKTFKIIKY